MNLVDTYALTKMLVDDDNVLFCLQSITGKCYWELKSLNSSQGKKIAGQFLKLFFDDIKRVNFTQEYCDKINDRLPSQYIKLVSHTVVSGSERSKLKHALKTCTKSLGSLRKVKLVEEHTAMELCTLDFASVLRNPYREDICNEVKKYALVSKSISLREKLCGYLAHDVEYREFKEFSVMPTGHDVPIDRYSLPLTKSTFLLVTCEVRGRDSVYCSIYNTKTGTTMSSTSQTDIREFLKRNDSPMICASDDMPELNRIYHDISLLESKEGVLMIVPEPSRLKLITIESLLGESPKHRCLEYLSFKHMRISHISESGNNLQRLECLKYVFDVYLTDALLLKNALQRLLDKKGIRMNATTDAMSSISNALFRSGLLSTYSYEGEFVSTLMLEGEVKNFVLGNVTELHRYGLELSIGASGLGGLKGHKPGTYSDVYYLDYDSFTTQILLKHPRLCMTIDTKTFKAVYKQKQLSEGLPVRKLYKNLLNTQCGNLSHNDRDAYKAMIKYGQLVMLDTLKQLDELGANILHVCSDGIYFKVNPDFNCSKLNLMLDSYTLEQFNFLHLGKGNGDVIVGNVGNLSFKGEYKYICEYTKKCLDAYIVGGDMSLYEVNEDSIEEFVEYNGSHRYVNFGENYAYFNIDKYMMSGYIEEKIESEEAYINYEYYWNICRRLGN